MCSESIENKKILFGACFKRGHTGKVRLFEIHLISSKFCFFSALIFLKYFNTFFHTDHKWLLLVSTRF